MGGSIFRLIWKPKVSILLTSYNNPTVKRTIESVFRQTYKNWELIILDDNSNQQIQKIYEPFLKDKRVVYWNSRISERDRFKESPYARNINVGLDMATGDLIVYLCDDVEYLPHKLETMVKFLKRTPQAKVCYNRQKIIYDRETINKIIQKTRNKEKYRGVIEFLKKYPHKNIEVGIIAPDRILRDPFARVDHNSVMHYKECVNEVGKWDTHSFGMADAHYWRKLATKYLFYPIKEVLEIHYAHEDSFSARIIRGEINGVKYK